MRDPNSVQFAKWQELMATGRMVGEDRPVGRVTWTDQRVEAVPIANEANGPFRTIYEQTSEDELPNIIGINRSRNLSQDAATCTIRIFNDFNATSERSDELMNTGYFSPGRGESPEIDQPSVYSQFLDVGYLSATDIETSWGYTKNTYYGVLRPNRVLKTYEGYGSDNFDEFGNPWAPTDPDYVAPESDTKLVLTGVWLVDSLDMASDGVITVNCRDLAKLLLEQPIFPPSVPLERFPLVYGPIVEETFIETEQKSKTIRDEGISTARLHSTSNDVWYGRGASIYGHRPRDAFDGNSGTYWLSVGNGSPNAGFSFEWIQADTKGDTVTEVFLNLKGTHYIVYVSVFENGSWQGGSTIPYDPDSPPAFPNGANIRYVKKITTGSDQSVSIKLPRAYKARYVRVTFHSLWDSNLGPFQYRAAVREFRVRYNRTKTVTWTVEHERFVTNEGEPGVITDWTLAVKELLAWAGFVREDWAAQTDPFLGRSADGDTLIIWGDLEMLGAPPKHETPKDWFANKSYMEALKTLKEALGTILFIDESGGAIWRMPNIFTTGNFIHDPDADPDTRLYIQEWPIEFHENVNLLDFSINMNDSQVRSDILVVGQNPATYAKSKQSNIVAGFDTTANVAGIDFSDILGGQLRPMIVPGEASKGFETREECQRMADLTALKILFTLRTASFTVPCHPGLQLDDQVRVFERSSNEYYVHYVSGIETDLDLLNGSWTMTVTTNWLGEDPTSKWFLGDANIQNTELVRSFPAILDRIGEV